MEKKICQSCAMPMETEQYGTEKDGSPSDTYCHYCYADGAFTSDDTLETMIATCAAHMQAEGVPEEDANIFLNQTLPGLARWKQA